MHDIQNFSSEPHGFDRIPFSEGIRASLKTLAIPLARDGLIVGKGAPITIDALMQTLRLTSNNEYIEIGLDDSRLSHVLIRKNLLKRISRERLSEFILRRVKPVMSENEIVELRLEIEIEIDERLA